MNSWGFKSIESLDPVVWQHSVGPEQGAAGSFPYQQNHCFLIDFDSPLPAYFSLWDSDDCNGLPHNDDRGHKRSRDVHPTMFAAKWCFLS